MEERVRDYTLEDNLRERLQELEGKVLDFYVRLASNDDWSHTRIVRGYEEHFNISNERIQKKES